MTVSSRGRYALRLMVDIAEHYGEWYVPIKDVAKRQNISVKYLEQIVAQLTKAGLLKSGRGSMGGYQLNKPAKEYSVGEILRIAENTMAPVACLEPETEKCERTDFCQTLKVWKGLQAAIDKHLNGITLHSLTKTLKASERNPRAKRKKRKYTKRAKKEEAETIAAPIPAPATPAAPEGQ